MNLNPLISILIPTYNNADLLVKTIRSIENQSYTNYEIIIVNDSSTDSTENVVNEISKLNPNIIYIKNIINEGVANSRNIAFNNSKGEYIAFLDSDDIWHKNKLQNQIKYIIDTGADICCTAFSVISYKGNHLHDIHNAKEHINLNDMLKNNNICLSSTLIKRAVFDNIKMRSNFFHEDYIFWLECLSRGYRIFFLDEVLMSYRLGGRSKNKLLCAKHRWSAYRNFMNYNILKSIYYMIFYIFSAIKKL